MKAEKEIIYYLLVSLTFIKVSLLTNEKIFTIADSQQHTKELESSVIRLMHILLQIRSVK